MLKGRGSEPDLYAQACTHFVLQQSVAYAVLWIVGTALVLYADHCPNYIHNRSTTSSSLVYDIFLTAHDMSAVFTRHIIYVSVVCTYWP